MILEKSDVNKIKNLRQDFLHQNLLKEERVNVFLINNPNVDRAYTKNGVKYELIDVINDRPLFISTDNLSASKATKTSSLHLGGDLGINIEGQNMRIGVWDGGFALVNHVEFMDDSSTPLTRITTPQTSLTNPVSNDHATHVMGTILAKGMNSNAKGMAPKAIAASYNWNNDIANVTGEILNNGLLISNHSYGMPVISESGTPIDSWYMGCYNDNARSWDELMYSAPYYMMVTSAGNSGTDNYIGGMQSGYDKLTLEKNAKNNIVVANSNPFVLSNGTVNIFPINSTSSQGPSDDGRIKPDITGDGTNLYSTYNTDNQSYATLSGTSMAAPNISGSLLLLQQYYNQIYGNFMWSSTLKALVCHSARDGGNIGPDAKYGWGLLDSKESAQIIAKSSYLPQEAFVKEQILNQGETFNFQFGINSGEKLKATLCWTDPPGISKNGILNDPSPALINDLDLRIIKDGITYLPWKLQIPNVSDPAIVGDNWVDNVERIDINVPDTGIYQLIVSHKGTLLNQQQKFSLVITGNSFQNLSINSSTANNHIFIYPNPTSNVLNISDKNNELSKYYITDISGKKIIDSELTLDKTIDISSFQTGVYFINFVQDGKIITKKIIKN